MYIDTIKKYYYFIVKKYIFSEVYKCILLLPEAESWVII